MTTAIPPGTLTIPGICHGLPINPLAADHEYVTTDTAGQHQDGDLIIGETLIHGALRIHYQAASDWRALALAASRIADWLEKVA
jgi:hypothetical protein